MFVSVFAKTLRCILLLAASLLIVSAAVTLSHSEESLCRSKLTLLHLNDTHGHYDSEKSQKDGIQGGFARAMTVIDGIRRTCERDGRTTLSFMAGDLFSGTAYGAVFKGSLGVRLINAMEFSAMTVGNHEFDYGLENLTLSLAPSMKFPLLSSNIRYQDGRLLFKPFVVIEMPGQECEILVFGLTTDSTPQLTFPRNVKGLVFDDPIDMARRIVQEHGKNRFVIALTHLGIEKDKQLAALCKGINVIIGGHSHTALTEPLKIGETLICQAGAYTSWVGRIDLDVTGNRVEKYSGELIKLDGNVDPDPTIDSIIDEHKSKMSPFFTEVVGSSAISIDGSLEAVRSSAPNDMGILVAHVMARATGAEAGIINAGAIRDGLKIGPITNADVYGILPFQNFVKKANLKGSDVEAALRRSLALPAKSGGKLQVYGLKYQISGEDVHIREVGSRPYSPEDNYAVALTDFILSGGDGYSDLASKSVSVAQDGMLLSQIFADFIKEKKEISENLLQSLRQSLPLRN